MSCEIDSKIVGGCDKPKVVIVKQVGIQGEVGTITPEDAQKIEKAVADSALAVKTADGAVVTANSAVTKADQAVEIAEGASSIADQASADALTAVNTANEANAKSDNAVQIATEAKDIAGGAKDSATASALEAKNQADRSTSEADKSGGSAVKAKASEVASAQSVLDAKTEVENAKAEVVKAQGEVTKAKAEVAKAQKFASDAETFSADAGNAAQVATDAVQYASDEADRSTAQANIATEQAKIATVQANEAKESATQANADLVTLQGQLKGYLPLAGGDLTGNLGIGSAQIANVGDTAVIYSDKDKGFTAPRMELDRSSGVVNVVSAQGMTNTTYRFEPTGSLKVNGKPVAMAEELKGYLPLTGGTLTGALTATSFRTPIDQPDPEVGIGNSRILGYTKAGSPTKITLFVQSTRSRTNGAYFELRSKDNGGFFRAVAIGSDGISHTFAVDGTSVTFDSQYVLTTGSQSFSEAQQVQVCKNIGARRVHAQGGDESTGVYWTQFSDGLQELTQVSRITAAIKNPTAGGFFMSDLLNVPFEVPFATVPAVVASLAGNTTGAISWVGYFDRSSTALRYIRLFSLSKRESDTYNLAFVAKGHWK